MLLLIPSPLFIPLLPCLACGLSVSHKSTGSSSQSRTESEVAGFELEDADLETDVELEGLEADVDAGVGGLTGASVSHKFMGSSSQSKTESEGVGFE